MSLAGYRQIQEAIINSLKSSSNPNLQQHPQGPIREYSFERPLVMGQTPLVYVEFRGAASLDNLVSGEGPRIMDYDIVCVDREASFEKAVMSVEELSEKVEKALRADRTLGGLVNNGWFLALTVEREVVEKTPQALGRTTWRIQGLG